MELCLHGMHRDITLTFIPARIEGVGIRARTVDVFASQGRARENSYISISGDLSVMNIPCLPLVVRQLSCNFRQSFYSS